MAARVGGVTKAMKLELVRIFVVRRSPYEHEIADFCDPVLAWLRKQPDAELALDCFKLAFELKRARGIDRLCQEAERYATYVRTAGVSPQEGPSGNTGKKSPKRKAAATKEPAEAAGGSDPAPAESDSP